MKHKSLLTTLGLCALMGALLLPVVASAQRPQGRTRGIYVHDTANREMKQ